MLARWPVTPNLRGLNTIRAEVKFLIVHTNTVAELVRVKSMLNSQANEENMNVTFI